MLLPAVELGIVPKPESIAGPGESPHQQMLSTRTTAPQYRDWRHRGLSRKSFRDAGWRVTRSEATMMNWSKYLPARDYICGLRRAGTAAFELAVNSKEAIVTDKMQSRCCYSSTEPSQMKFRLPDRFLPSVHMAQ
jgi:hypothetical protein